jgi:type II secretory pathway pseudopilin PulG
MKSFRHKSARRFRAADARCTGQTLVEMMITMSIFCWLMAGLIAVQFFGMRQDQLIESKLGASDQSRKAFDQMTLEIRKAKLFRIGNGSQTTFTPIPNGTGQQGTAVQLNFSTDTNSYVRYYFETNNARLCRIASGVGGYKIIAQDLTNEMSFRAVNYTGTNLVTDITYKYVICVALHFKQYQYPLTQVGPGYLYDYYKIEFKVTPHCPDGA